MSNTTYDINLTSFKQLIGIDNDADDARLSDVLDSAENAAVRRSHRTKQELKDLEDELHYPSDFREAVYCLAAYTWTGDDKWQRIADTHIKDFRRLQRR